MSWKMGVIGLRILLEILSRLGVVPFDHRLRHESYRDLVNLKVRERGGGDLG